MGSQRVRHDGVTKREHEATGEQEWYLFLFNALFPVVIVPGI